MVQIVVGYGLVDRTCGAVRCGAAVQLVAQIVRDVVLIAIERNLEERFRAVQRAVG